MLGVKCNSEKIWACKVEIKQNVRKLQEGQGLEEYEPSDLRGVVTLKTQVRD